MTQTYRAAVVGAGTGGQLSMAGLAASDRYELVAVSDIAEPARQRIEADYPGVKTFADHNEMFASVKPDVVCVSTWPPSHLPVALDAIRSGLKGLLAEKPLSDTAQDGRALLDAIKEARLPVVVPHNLLVLDHAQAILDDVRSGAIGELKLVEIQCDKWDIINAGIHWMNFFVMLTGLDPVDWVMAQCDDRTRTYRDGMQVETMAVTYVQTRSGIRAVMNTGDYVQVNDPGKGLLFRLVGTTGQIQFWGWEGAYRLFNADYPAGDLRQPRGSEAGGHQRHLENLARQIDAGQPDYAVAESSLMALEICEAAYVSSRHGCMVRFPFADFTPPAGNDWQPGLPYQGQGGGRDGRTLPEQDPDQ